MAEVYTSGAWTVKPGENDAFVEDWTAFATWASEQPGSGTFRLVQDTDDPSHYMSFANWDSIEAQAAWKAQPEFRERMGRIRSHCEDFRPSVFEVVAQLG